MCLVGQRYELWNSCTTPWGSAVCSQKAASIHPTTPQVAAGPRNLDCSTTVKPDNSPVLLYHLSSFCCSCTNHIHRFYLWACSLAPMRSLPLFAIARLHLLYGEETEETSSTDLPHFWGKKIASVETWYFSVTITWALAVLHQQQFLRRKKGEVWLPPQAAHKVEIILFVISCITLIYYKSGVAFLFCFVFFMLTSHYWIPGVFTKGFGFFPLSHNRFSLHNSWSFFWVVLSVILTHRSESWPLLAEQSRMRVPLADLSISHRGQLSRAKSYTEGIYSVFIALANLPR